MAAFNHYYYNAQLKSYLVQFCAIFGGMQIQIGKSETKEARLIPVPIIVAQQDRVAAAIKAGNTQNKMIRLPLFSAHISDIQFARDRQKGVGVVRRSTFMPSGGVFPDDVTVNESRMPVPYDLTINLNIYASNQDQMMQLLEQILMIFDPILQIQTSDDYFDWTKLTVVELTNISDESNYPSGVERRILQKVISFNVPAYVSIPHEQHKRYVADILLRLGTISSQATTWEDIYNEFDAQNIEATPIFVLDDVDLGTPEFK